MLFIGLDIIWPTLEYNNNSLKIRVQCLGFIFLTVCMVVCFVFVILFFWDLPGSLLNFFSYPIFVISLVIKILD